MSIQLPPAPMPCIDSIYNAIGLSAETRFVLQLANKLNAAVSGQERSPLKVFVQVNTSGEETKFGVEPDKALELARHIHENCKSLHFAGLMTIGMPDYTSKPENFEVAFPNSRTDI